jgi:uncharacterized protein YceH (UPF0502 family)
MIQLPRRSVTRFFIPLIDVLTLLFCIFLLMPVVKATGEGDEVAGREPAAKAVTPSADDGDLTRRLEQARQELERLRKEQIETLQQRLAIQVLEIDPKTGRLYYYDGPDRVEIASAHEAGRLIDRQKREAGGRELYYLFLFPRQVTGYPEERQVKEYERWFAGVAHGFDNPRATR